ncbi:unnamed protein product [Trichogramma brassicae]|uniref:Uncharacterized protein n=1 Tax=Trichogramma brassicae TaxID=86971 RepID=A0A6H5HS69_9HYME|nr:unnamed protein product [Trichogramma brassicae]
MTYNDTITICVSRRIAFDLVPDTFAQPRRMRSTIFVSGSGRQPRVLTSRLSLRRLMVTGLRSHPGRVPFHSARAGFLRRHPLFQRVQQTETSRSPARLRRPLARPARTAARRNCYVGSRQSPNRGLVLHARVVRRLMRRSRWAADGRGARFVVKEAPRRSIRRRRALCAQVEPWQRMRPWLCPEEAERARAPDWRGAYGGILNGALLYTYFTSPMRIAEDGTSLLCKTAPDICASNPQSAISYVEKADLSAHMLPAYPETKIVESRFVAAGQNFPVQDQSDPNAVIDSRPSGYVDKEGNLVDSRLLSEPRQNVVTFAEDKEHPSCQEPPARFSDFPLPPVETTTIVTNDQPQQQSVQQQPPLAFADKEAGNFIANGEHSIVVDSLDIQYSYDSRYNNLAGQTVPITLKHHHPHHRQGHTQASQQYVHQNCGTIHSGMLRVAEPGTSSSNQRSMTLQNPKRKIISNTQIAQNTFSTLECENRRGRGVNVDGRNTGQVASAKGNFCAGSAV